MCVFTTAAGREASEGQHIVSCTSQDHGKTWSKPVQIEEPGKETSSWAMPYLTKYDRVYVFYDYNGDKIHELNGKPINDDVLGWYCYKYSEDEGKTWSQRYRLDVRKTKIDFENDWKGEVQIMWGIGKPLDVDGNVCNGRDFRQFGWGRFKANMEDLSLNNIEIGDLSLGEVAPKYKLTMLRIYDRPLMNTEVIGNHRNFMK